MAAGVILGSDWRLIGVRLVPMKPPATRIAGIALHYAPRLTGAKPMGQAAENIRHVELLFEISRDIAEVHRRLGENERQRRENEHERENLLGMLKALDDQKRAVLEGRPLP
jgi:hypothetical protein